MLSSKRRPLTQKPVCCLLRCDWRQALIARQPELAVLWGLSLAMSLSLFCFLLLHAALVLRNQTTNETAKYKQVLRFMTARHPGEEKAESSAPAEERFSAAAEADPPQSQVSEKKPNGEESDDALPARKRAFHAVSSLSPSQQAVFFVAKRLPRNLSASEAAARIRQSRLCYDQGKWCEKASSSSSRLATAAKGSAGPSLVRCDAGVARNCFEALFFKRWLHESG